MKVWSGQIDKIPIEKFLENFEVSKSIRFLFNIISQTTSIWQRFSGSLAACFFIFSRHWPSKFNRFIRWNQNMWETKARLFNFSSFSLSIQANEITKQTQNSLIWNFLWNEGLQVMNECISKTPQKKNYLSPEWIILQTPHFQVPSIKERNKPK